MTKKLTKIDRLVRDAWEHGDCITLCNKSRIIFDGKIQYLEVEHVQNNSLRYLRIARKGLHSPATDILLPKVSTTIILMKTRLEAILGAKIFSTPRQGHFIHSERLLPSIWHRLEPRRLLVPIPILEYHDTLEEISEISLTINAAQAD